MADVDLVTTELRGGFHPEQVPIEAGSSAGLTTKSLTPAKLAFRRFLRHRLAVGSLILLGLIALVVVFAPLTARYNQEDQIPHAPTEGVGYLSPRADAWLGTDSIGHDMYSRIIWGGRVSIFIGIAVAILATAGGTIIGAVAGYRGGVLDDILMRVTDVFLAFPLLVALLVMRNMFKELSWMGWLFGELSGLRFIIVLLAFVSWMVVARIVRGTTLSLKEREFVEAARSVGATDVRILAGHIIPNALGPIIVAMTTTVAAAIITESTLSFFGYGVQASEGKASWGNLLADSRGVIQTGYWWVAVFPAIALVVTVLCINFIGDGLRDAFDPKQSKGRA